MTGVNLPPFRARRVPRGDGSLAVRDFAGDGPAFVLMHGFPDNGHSYDLLVPPLVAAGRRVVTFDFLGFGDSDKPTGRRYGFAQQREDLDAVVDALDLGRIVTVGHDAGGPTAVDYGLDNPDRTAAVVLMNAFYGASPALRVPELIALFSHPDLAALARHFLASPGQLAWLLDFQRQRLAVGLSDAQRARYFDFLGPVIDDNFRLSGAGRAFGQMTAGLPASIANNTRRLIDLRRSDVPFRLVWGRADPYLHVEIAEQLAGAARRASLHILEAGHWPQIDEPEAVAAVLLSDADENSATRTP